MQLRFLFWFITFMLYAVKWRLQKRKQGSNNISFLDFADECRKFGSFEDMFFEKESKNNKIYNGRSLKLNIQYECKFIFAHGQKDVGDVLNKSKM